MLLADCHSHLDCYPPARVAGMVERAATAGLGVVMAAGSDLAASQASVSLAARHPLLRAGVGLHPLRVTDDMPDAVYHALDALAADPRVVVWSECGLDFAAGTASRATQRIAFERQLRLARARDLAAIVHIVDAADDALAVLAATGMAARAAVHYFVGGPDLAERYVAAGLYVSVGKPATRAEHGPLREALRDLPLDRLLLETDTYPLPGRTTEPADVAQVAAAVAALRGCSPAEIAATTTANLVHLLRPRLVLDRP